mmetsp:Transcript_30621/g.79954  ORF Transcript_30621/g.79954 Transcript_30621/m.79954 type:complete len:370 (-) Transcript_30621:262-1371(-)
MMGSMFYTTLLDPTNVAQGSNGLTSSSPPPAASVVLPLLLPEVECPPSPADSEFRESVERASPLKLPRASSRPKHALSHLFEQSPALEKVLNASEKFDGTLTDMLDVAAPVSKLYSISRHPENEPTGKNAWTKGEGRTVTMDQILRPSSPCDDKEEVTSDDPSPKKRKYVEEDDCESDENEGELSSAGSDKKRAKKNRLYFVFSPTEALRQINKVYETKEKKIFNDGSRSIVQFCLAACADYMIANNCHWDEDVEVIESETLLGHVMDHLQACSQAEPTEVELLLQERAPGNWKRWIRCALGKMPQVFTLNSYKKSQERHFGVTVALFDDLVIDETNVQDKIYVDFVNKAVKTKAEKKRAIKKKKRGEA